MTNRENKYLTRRKSKFGKRRTRRITRSGKGFTSRNYTRKAVELRKLGLDPDVEKEIMDSVKRESAATMLQKNIGNYANKTRKRRLIQELMEYELDDPDSLHFDIFDPDLIRILDSVTTSIRLSIRHRKNRTLIRILGKIYNGLNEFRDERDNINYKNVLRAFKILVKKIFDIKIGDYHGSINENNFLESDKLYDLLITPLMGSVD